MDRFMMALLLLVTPVFGKDFTSQPLSTISAEPAVIAQAYPTPDHFPPYCPSLSSCPTKNQGDGDCGGSIKEYDFTLWTRQFGTFPNPEPVDVNANYACKEGNYGSSFVDLFDFEVWRRNTTEGFFVPSPTSPVTPTAIPSPYISPTNAPNPTATPIPTSPPASITPIPTSTPSSPTPTTIASCPTTSTETYRSEIIICHTETVQCTLADTDRNDIRLVNGYDSVSNQTKGLVDYSGDIDNVLPPQFATILNQGLPIVSNVYKVRTDGSPYPITLIGLQTTLGSVVRPPNSDHYPAANGGQAFVVYAHTPYLTLRYTGEDDIISGYIVYLEGVCVDPNLQALYDQSNPAGVAHPVGRGYLPVPLRQQKIGTMQGSELKVGIRDTGQLMDPRARKDWWQGY